MNNISAECNIKILNKISFIHNDIIEQKNYDALVCSTNYRLKNEKHKKSIDYQIHEAAGPELDKECENILGVKLGEAVVTGAYRLEKTNNIHFIIHTIGPAYKRISRIEARKILADCYTNVLNRAREYNCHSILSPVIGLGYVGYAKGTQMSIAFSSIYNWIKDNPLYEIKVSLCSTSDRDKDYYDQVFSQYKQHGKCIMIDDDSIALVLEGGGGKGAFQMGVWEVLTQRGLAEKITGLSGTSVGAINTYLFLSDKSIFEQEKIWLDFKQGDLINFGRSQKSIEAKMDEVGFCESKNENRNIFSTIVIRKNLRFDRKYVSWEGRNISQIKKLVLASAALPILFKPVKLDDGYIAIDGGFLSLEQIKGLREYTNVPIQPLYDIGYRKFVIVYTEPKSKADSIIDDEVKRYGDAIFCRIFPKDDLGDMTKINRELTEDRIDKGRKAATEAIVAKEKQIIDFEDLKTWKPLYE